MRSRLSALYAHIGVAITALLCWTVPVSSSEQGHNLGKAGPMIEGDAQIIGARFLDVDGNIRRLGDDNGAGPVALVFLGTHCPISNRYVPELNAFAKLAKKQGIDFYGVLSENRTTWDEAEAFRDENNLKFPILLDPARDLANRLKPLATPEAFVVNTDDTLVYRGRIDNRYAKIGELRRVTTKHDLKATFKKLAKSETVTPHSTVPVGCDMGYDPEETPIRVTYTQHIAPILDANCVECHQTGGVAPFPLTSYEQSRDTAGTIEYVTTEGLMPPWRPETEHGRFRDERYLTDYQKKLLQYWSEQDAPEGDERWSSPAVKLPDPGWRLGTPDLVLKPERPLQIPATGEDIYRYFVIPSGLRSDKTIIGMDFMPGDNTVVHHANFFVDYSGRARALDAKDDAPGFSVFGKGSFMSYDDGDAAGFGLGGWTPGAEPYLMPKDVGMWLPKGGDIVIEIHYHLSGKATEDQSSIGFYFAKGYRKNYVDGLLLGTQSLNIKPGDDHYVRHTKMKVKTGFKLVDVMPHMHYAGKKVRMQVTYPDGKTEALIGIDDWDFRWQNRYLFRKPKHIPKGSRIDAWWIYDNSEDNPDNPAYPPKKIKWGWGTQDEMAELWLSVVPNNPRKRDQLITAAWNSWLKTDSKPLPK